MNDFAFENLLKIDFNQAWLFITDTLRNPASNLIAFLLILSVLTIVMLLVIVALLWMFAGSSDDEDEYEDIDAESTETLESPTPAGEVAPIAVEEPRLEEGWETPAPVVPVEPTLEELRALRRRRWISAVFWALAVVAVWVAGGWVTSTDRICLSCHTSEAVHAARQTGHGDVHASVSCVSCHETASRAAALTVAVPGRAIHFLGGFAKPEMAEDYGTPVAVKNCLACHDRAIEKTVSNSDTGIRVSHKEPLAAGATCIDCHAMRLDLGTVDNVTVGMEPCLRCHDTKQASAECAYCHIGDVSRATASRSPIKAKRHDSELDCTGCHSVKTCDACHGTRMPHSKDFMGSGHAREAVEDIWYNGGKTCKRCHTDTRRPCTKCHKGTFPSHGVPTFARDHQVSDPYGRGCDDCHGYLAWMRGRNMCANCHEEYPMLDDYR